MRLSTDAKEAGQDVAHERLFTPGYRCKHRRLVYIYYSSEEETPLEVYFDDFSVEHVKSSVVQIDDYYPFGLKYASTESDYRGLPTGERNKILNVIKLVTFLNL